MPGDVSILDPLEVLITAPTEERVRVGLVVPRSGVLGLMSPSVIDAAMLATGEINEAGGFGGKPADIVLVDGARTAEAVSGEVARLIESHSVDAFVAFHSSEVLEAVEPHIGSRIPYLVTSSHTGAARVPGVWYLGDGPRYLAEGYRYLIRSTRIKRWAVVGNDNIWPRAMASVVRSVARAERASIVLERAIPAGDNVPRYAARIARDLRSSRVEGVVINLVGRDQVTLNRALRDLGMDGSIVRLASGLEENGLLALGGDRTGLLYSTLGAQVVAADAIARPRVPSRAQADSPVHIRWAQNCYHGVHLLAALADAGMLSAMSLRRPRLSGLADRTGWNGEVLNQRIHEPRLAVADGVRLKATAL